jgi:hypothetical protein
MKYRSRTLIRGRAVALCMAAGVVALAISACGSSSSSSAGSAAASGTAVASSNARYEARLNLAKCLRQNGLPNVPDPSPGGGGAAGGAGGIFRQLASVPRSHVQSALQACQTYLRQAFPAANLSPAQQAQFRQAFVKYAECMRVNHVNIPDPGSTGSGPTGGFGFRGAISPTVRNSPAFQSANAKCASLRPRFGRFGAGGGAGGGATGGGPGA